MNQEISNIFGSKDTRDEIPSIITNPFLGEHIEDIMMRTYRNSFSKQFTTYATIGFRNGNTSGEQRIEANNLPELLMKVYEFCQSLEKTKL